jgi:two-component sensor histidine kinase
MLSIIALAVQSQGGSQLKHLDILLDTNETPFELIKERSFTPLEDLHFNFGFDSNTIVWLRMRVQNTHPYPFESILAIDNPLLENITLFLPDGTIEERGLLQRSQGTYLHPAFTITLESQSHTTLYLKISNSTTMLSGGVFLYDKATFTRLDRGLQINIALFLGLLSGLLIYGLLLFIYTRNRSYLLYALYLLTLLFHQLTYVGFLPLYAPSWFSAIDNIIVVPKIAAIIITAALFAQDFLKTTEIPLIYKGYQTFIIALLLQIPLFGTPWFYYPEVTIITGLLFIAYNLWAGLYMYFHGNKQARFFIVGWSVLIVGFFLMIVDALGFVSIMYHFPNLILWLTVIEALFLLLAFVDKLSILRHQKEEYEAKLIAELEQRNAIIATEVNAQTQAFKHLYRELHHRVKNNLQIILSIIRLQSDHSDECANNQAFLNLENRIRSIAKTHELLYHKECIDAINMSEYIQSLCEELVSSLSSKPLQFKYNIALALPLQEAVYIGLIVNELVSNSIKYAPQSLEIELSLKYKNSKECVLHVSDQGDGYDPAQTPQGALGLKLVKILACEQLNGTFTTDTKKGSIYNIRFSI